MCMTCGGRCLLCGEPSVYIIVAPPRLCIAVVHACEEHKIEVRTKVEREIELREAAPWN